MKVGTFFSGVGSPEQALRNLDIKHEVEFACDIDKYAKETYLKNFKPKLFATDITTLDMKDLPYVDLLVFGFPCQAFSLAGKRQGFDDTRGTLFYDALRYLREHKPRYFIAENVKGLLSHDNSKTFQTIIDCLAKTINYQMSLMPFENLGYHIHHKVLNTKDFGLPQNRERIFIIGIRDDEDNNFNFPREIPLELKLKDILLDNPKYIKKVLGGLQKNTFQGKGDISSSLTSAMGEGGGHIPIVEIDTPIKVDEKYYLSDKMIKGIEKTKFNSYANIVQKTDISACLLSTDYKMPKCVEVDEKYYLSDKAVKGIENSTYERKKNIVQKSDVCATLLGRDYKDPKCIETKGQDSLISHSLYPRSSKTGKGGSGHLSKSDGTSYCLDTGNAQAIEKQNRIRRLTPIECERLQGFPDNFTEGVSDTQRYKQMGNTITVNVIQAILKNLLK